MTRIVLAPSGVVSDVPEMFDAFAALADEHPGVRLHTHLHHHEDTRFAQARYCTSPWRILVDHGFATDKLWVAHAVTPNENGSTLAGSAFRPGEDGDFSSVVTGAMTVCADGNASVSLQLGVGTLLPPGQHTTSRCL